MSDASESLLDRRRVLDLERDRDGRRDSDRDSERASARRRVPDRDGGDADIEEDRRFLGDGDRDLDGDLESLRLEGGWRLLLRGDRLLEREML